MKLVDYPWNRSTIELGFAYRNITIRLGYSTIVDSRLMKIPVDCYRENQIEKVFNSIGHQL